MKMLVITTDNILYYTDNILFGEKSVRFIDWEGNDNTVPIEKIAVNGIRIYIDRDKSVTYSGSRIINHFWEVLEETYYRTELKFRAENNMVYESSMDIIPKIIARINKISYEIN